MYQIIKIAQEQAFNSNCNSQRVGAVIFKDDVYLASGYNYSPVDCLNRGFCYEGVGKCTDTNLPSKAIHAEMMAIAYCTNNQISPEGASIYITHAPCINCVKSIVAVGIKKIVIPREQANSDRWVRAYDFIEETFLKPYGVKVQVYQQAVKTIAHLG